MSSRPAYQSYKPVQLVANSAAQAQVDNSPGDSHQAFPQHKRAASEPDESGSARLASESMQVNMSPQLRNHMLGSLKAPSPETPMSPSPPLGDGGEDHADLIDDPRDKSDAIRICTAAGSAMLQCTLPDST
jgi:hypothetical protein